MKKLLLFFPVILIATACSQKNDSLFRLLTPDESGITFRNDIFENDEFNILNLSYLYNGGGVSVGDFDNNGLPDIFFTGNMVDNKLYLNRGEMKFEDITEAAGVASPGKWMYGSATVDINSDGWLDLYVCASIAGKEEDRRNMLFINQGLNEAGTPTFNEEAKAYGIDDSGYSSQAAFLDYDADGDLDLFILCNSKVEGIPAVYRPKVDDGSSDNRDKLYRNNGDGTFSDVSDETGILKEGFGLGVAVLDVNKDGLSDIYVGNDYITNDLFYVNEGGESFQDGIDNMMMHQSRFSMGNDAADINNDGHLDILTLDMLPETNLRKKTVVTGQGYIVYIYDNRYGYTHQYIRNMLQLNNGNMSFSEIGQLAGVHQTEWSWSPLFADIDNDGFKDLLVTNGFPKDITDNDFINFRKKAGAFTSKEQLIAQIPSVKIPNYAYRNNGDLTFKDLSAEWGFTQASFSNGAAFADFDLDGDLDYVVNNINDPAFLYENTLLDKETQKANYLRITLKGPANNPSALGAKVSISYGNDKTQYHEQNIYRGYVSTVEDVVHFGLGEDSLVKQVSVIWPDGKISELNSVQANQTIELNSKDSRSPQTQEISQANKLFSDLSEDLVSQYVHEEQDFIDYNIQRNIPHKFSQFGPSISVGDINGDEKEDLILGGSKDFATQALIQKNDGSFESSAALTNASVAEEDMGSLLFDADGDGDLDLYLVSGSFEYPEGNQHLQDRLMLNNGKGKFTLASDALPEIRSSASCVRAADFDQDGDLDLFVGGRVVVGAYPKPAQSYLLQNNEGKFSNVTSALGSELERVGMVTDAIWSDFNQDGAVDLIVAGEFMPISFFANQGGKLVKQDNTGISHLTGWWNSIVAGDFDSDGDMDYVAGNLGENNFYCASPEQPVRITANDFDKNGSLDAVLSCYLKAEDGTMKPFAVHSWDELNAQSPIFRVRFDKYSEYGQTSIDSLFTGEQLTGATVLEANHMATSYIENLGEGKFRMTRLPLEAQFAPVNGMLAMDVNKDMHLDIVMVGNDYGNEVNSGQFDAFTGLILLGDGSGKFKAAALEESGFFVNGDAKALIRLVDTQGEEVFIASQNRGPLKAFKLNDKGSKSFSPEVLDFSARLFYEDGRVQAYEFNYGSGFLSQSTRTLILDESVTKLEISDYAGKTREISLVKKTLKEIEPSAGK